MPAALKQQLAVGGRLVIPVGTEGGLQELLCITRLSDSEYEQASYGDVRFVPLLGEEGWP